jgi:hypothetical protein
VTEALTSVWRQIGLPLEAQRVPRRSTVAHTRSYDLLERDELSLNRSLVPLIPAEVGTKFFGFGRVLGPWIPAFAGMSGDWFNGGANPN